MEWKLPKEPSPKKVKASCSVDKVMLTVFWDAEGIILADFFFACRHKHEQRVLFRYHNVSKAGSGKEKKKQASKRTFPSPPDYTPPHRAGVTMATIEECSFQLLEHPHYSPDLAPSHFFIFPEMKRQLKGRRFEDRNEICTVTEEWLLAQPPRFYFQELFKVKKIWQKCISLDVGWVEK